MTIKKVEIAKELKEIIEHAVSLAKEDITSVWTDPDDKRMLISFICEDIKREDLSRLEALEDYLYEIRPLYTHYMFAVVHSYEEQQILLYSKNGGFAW